MVKKKGPDAKVVEIIQFQNEYAEKYNRRHPRWMAMEKYADGSERKDQISTLLFEKDLSECNRIEKAKVNKIDSVIPDSSQFYDRTIDHIKRISRAAFDAEKCIDQQKEVVNALCLLKVDPILSDVCWAFYRRSPLDLLGARKDNESRSHLIIKTIEFINRKAYSQYCLMYAAGIFQDDYIAGIYADYIAYVPLFRFCVGAEIGKPFFADVFDLCMSEVHESVKKWRSDNRMPKDFKYLIPPRGHVSADKSKASTKSLWVSKNTSEADHKFTRSADDKCILLKIGGTWTPTLSFQKSPLKNDAIIVGERFRRNIKLFHLESLQKEIKNSPLLIPYSSIILDLNYLQRDAALLSLSTIIRITDAAARRFYINFVESNFQLKNPKKLLRFLQNLAVPNNVCRVLNARHCGEGALFLDCCGEFVKVSKGKLIADRISVDSRTPSGTHSAPCLPLPLKNCKKAIDYIMNKLGNNVVTETDNDYNAEQWIAVADLMILDLDKYFNKLQKTFKTDSGVDDLPAFGPEITKELDAYFEILKRALEVQRKFFKRSKKRLDTLQYRVPLRGLYHYRKHSRRRKKLSNTEKFWDNLGDDTIEDDMQTYFETIPRAVIRPSNIVKISILDNAGSDRDSYEIWYIGKYDGKKYKIVAVEEDVNGQLERRKIITCHVSLPKDSPVLFNVTALTPNNLSMEGLTDREHRNDFVNLALMLVNVLKEIYL